MALSVGAIRGYLELDGVGQFRAGLASGQRDLDLRGAADDLRDIGPARGRGGCGGSGGARAQDERGKGDAREGCCGPAWTEGDTIHA